MDYKKEILRQMETLTRWETMSEIKGNLDDISRGWDQILYEDGRYYKYDYARKHSYPEEYGDELTGEELKKYLALREVKEGLDSGKIKAGVSKSIEL